jgi:hypothetical protein
MNFKGILIEIATIIFAVLLALAGEGLWEHHKTMEMVDVSAERLNKEIADNLCELVRTEKSATLKYNNLLALESEVKNNASFADLANKFNGYEGVFINSSTWKRILNDKIETYFPVDYIEKAYNIYNVVEIAQLEKESLIKFLFSDIYFNKDKEKTAFEISKLYYKELIRLCREAQKEHKKFIEEYDGKNYKQVIAKCDSISALFAK